MALTRKKAQAAEETDFWQKQNDIDKFVTETRTRKVISTIFEPLMDNQTLLQQKIEFEITKQLSNHEDRLNAAEYSLYKTDVPDTRFTSIYEKLTFLEASRQKDIESNKAMQLNIDNKFQETLFAIDCKIRDLDQYKSQYEGLCQRVKEQSDNINTYMDECMTKVGNYFRRTDE